MNFQCKNCGGNMVFSPKEQKMYCPYCEGLDCEDVKGDTSTTVCASCGGEISIGEHISASRCPYCNNYLVFDERVVGQYKPDVIIPFKISKEDAVHTIEKELKKRFFAPVSFLHEKTLDDMQGYYVPFFLYGYKAEGNYVGTGTVVRTWRSGDYDYTETSYFDIRRRMYAEYENIPADASTDMDDKAMDLIEPFDYKGLMSFNPKYLSGFFGEVYNNPADFYEKRAKQKAVDSAGSLLHESISGYTTTHAVQDTTTLTDGKVEYSLFPVWLYKYSFGGKTYPVYVNGQTGKVIGKTPISRLKVLLYAVTGGALLFGAIQLLVGIMGVL